MCRHPFRRMDPALLIDRIQTMAERIAANVAPRRLNLLLFDLFAGLALLLAMVACTASRLTGRLNERENSESALPSARKSAMCRDSC